MEDKFISANQTKYIWGVRYKPNIERLNEMASCLRGEIDCASFAASGDESVSTYRYLDNAHFFYQSSFPNDEKVLVFEIEANAFLWKMVRTITGTLIELDRDNKPVDSFKKILEAKNRCMAGVTAPSAGLFLWNVKFDGIRRHP